MFDESIVKCALPTQRFCQYNNPCNHLRVLAGKRHHKTNRLPNHQLLWEAYQKRVCFRNDALEPNLTDSEEEEIQLEIEASNIACMAGMLMWLDKEQRLFYIIGGVFEIDHNMASEIFKTSQGCTIVASL